MQEGNEDGNVAVGLDLGTGGVRAVAMSLGGELIAASRSKLPREATRVDGVCVEQDPRAWTASAQHALRELTAALPASSKIFGISVCATSGTFLLADENRRPLTPGLMYNDLRGVKWAARVASALRDDLAPYGIQIAPAFALPKIVDLNRRDPQLFRRCQYLIHQTDWLIGMLCGEFGVTDVSTALKSGVDPGTLQWPRAIEESLGIPLRMMPRVVLPGTRIGKVTSHAAADTGLVAGTIVVAGCTDGTAGFLASGATEPGDLNVTLGTTLVLKAISRSPLIDPQGVLYNHRHPSGGYLPGAASNTGGDWVDIHFPDTDLRALGRDAARLLPTRRFVYPLIKTGERFPFACETATGFGLDEIEHPAERYAAGMEGVAFLERMGIDRLESLGLEIGPTIRATGGGAAGEAWLAIRAAVNQRVYCVPKHPECAVGAAVLAAVPQLGSCRQAVAAIVRPGRAIEPDSVLASAYARLYEQFQDALRQRGYL